MVDLSQVGDADHEARLSVDGSARANSEEGSTALGPGRSEHEKDCGGLEAVQMTIATQLVGPGPVGTSQVVVVGGPTEPRDPHIGHAVSLDGNHSGGTWPEGED